MDQEQSETGCLPKIIVTGASGFVGSHFLNAVKEDFQIFAVARRNQRAAGVDAHPNIHWIRGDIGVRKTVGRIIDQIQREAGSIDFVFHFAGYYDFSNKATPEYERTNVDGTRYLLEELERLQPKRFIFSSSLTVTDFVNSRRTIDEESPLDADFPYGRTKKAAEELVKAHSEKFPCTIVRLAAIYSDCCEYGPLYVFLNTWLTRRWNARILAGKGNSAIPYLHVIDLNRMMLKVIKNHQRLGRCDILLASPDGCTSHNELFRVATKYYFGRPARPAYVPVWFATFGLALQTFWGFLTRKPSFERLWMLKYVDKRMDVDTHRTKKLIDWEPKQRYHILRRLLFLIETKKSNPIEWELKNQVVFHKRITDRPNLRIFEAMLSLQSEVIRDHADYLLSSRHTDLFPNYQQLDEQEIALRCEHIYKMLENVIHSGDRMHILSYANFLAKERHKEGFPYEEVRVSIHRFIGAVETALREHPNLANMQQKIHDEIYMTRQLILDEIEDVYERLANDHPCQECKANKESVCTHETALTDVREVSSININ